MKTYKYIALALSLASMAALTAACDDDEDYDNPSGETFIYSIAVSNGGFTGAENIVGDVDEQTREITFVIPAETDIEAVKFSTKLSLGASLDRESYDVSTGETDITVVNNANTSVYHATFAMLPAKENPVLTSIRCKDADGNLRDGFISDVTGTVYLNCEGSATAELVEVAMLPKRTEYVFTAAVNGVISSDDPGKLEMDFLGLTKSYDISFAGVPVFGGDFSAAVVYDHSNHEGSMIYDDFSAENTRWAQFDGEAMLVVSRQGGTNPKVLYYDEVASGSPLDHLLDKSVITGGTYEVSAGSIANGHFYVCNLTTGIDPTLPLKIYHWVDVSATCETLMEFGGNDAVKGRWGDNMSVCLDENGDGYIYFIDHAQGSSALRFSVTGYTSISAEPEVLTTPYSVAYYGTVNAVPDEDNLYVLTSTYQRAILLVDKDLALVNVIETKDGSDYPCVAETDARIVSYNGERYLVTCNSYGWHYKGSQTLRVYDLSQGLNASLAFTNFNQGDRPILWQYSLNGSNCSAFSANTGAGIGDDGCLRLMGAAPRSGFVMVEVPKKR